MISLFILSTLEGYPDYMQMAVDGTANGPVYNSHEYVKALFIVFILIGSIFCVNLFIAIVGMNYNIA